MITKLFTVATAIILPVVLAIPNAQVLAQGLSPNAANSFAPIAKRDFEAGQCKFQAQVVQHCRGAGTTTFIVIPSVIDNADQVITKPANGRAVNLDNGPWNITGLGQDFLVEVQDSGVNCK